MKKIVLFIGFTAFMQLFALAQDKAVTIPGSQIKKINSSVVSQQDYELQIMLPSGYGKTNKLYPVLYLMDSQWDFPLATALYGQQYYDGFVPEMIIVGITWTGKYSNPDSLRVRDYTPTNQKQSIQSGGADKFIAALKTEIFPFIELHYKADKNNRTLMGCSLGGLFTLYILFTEPGLFKQYVAASPAIGWDDEVIYQFEKKYFENNSKPDARLYLCVGAVERGVPGFQKFANLLSSRHYKQLQIKSEILDNTGHSGTKGIGFEHGMQYSFERPSVQLTNGQLKKFAGQYKSKEGNEIEIKAENNKPVLYFNSENKFTLNAINKNELYSTAEFLNLHLKEDDDGNITGFELQRYGGNQFFTKSK